MEFLHIWSIELGREPAARRRAYANEALRAILAAHLPGGAEIEIVAGEHGKPRLAAGGPEFNLSHSGELALVALSAEHPVGVDVEQVRAERDAVALAEKALGPDDLRAVREARPGERDAVFHRLWARHEARLKCLGAGIFSQQSVDTSMVLVQDLEMASGYVASVAIEAPRIPSLRHWTFDPKALRIAGNRVS